jgi:hypothetical protein
MIVGVAVGSRVGIGACVGVAGTRPVGKTMNVGGASVRVGASVIVAGSVGVGGRWSNAGRTIKLTVPPQYKVSAPAIMIARQPYPSCWTEDNPAIHSRKDGRRTSSSYPSSSV